MLLGLAHITKELAWLCRRGAPNAKDVTAACLDQGITIEDLSQALRTNRFGRKRKRTDWSRCDGHEVFENPILVGEEVKRFEGAPEHFPPLPPDHTYLSTPVRLRALIDISVRV